LLRAEAGNKGKLSNSIVAIFKLYYFYLIGWKSVIFDFGV
jgi:hypothetical protein